MHVPDSQRDSVDKPNSVARVSRSIHPTAPILTSQFSSVGTQRRTQKVHTSENNVTVDKKLAGAIKKLGKDNTFTC